MVLAARHCGGNDDKHRGHRDRNEPAHPIDPGAPVAAEGAVNEPADQYAADPTEDGEPNGSVVSAAWCNELAQQADDDSGNDHSDDFHDVSLLQPATSPASYLTALDKTPVPLR